MKKMNLKKFWIIIFIFFFSFFFTNKVNASSFKAKLECPSSANTNETITCNIYVTTDTSTAIESVTFSELVNATVVNNSIDYNIVPADEETSIGSVNFKIGAEDADVYITTKVKPSGNGLQTATAPETIRTISSINTLKSLTVDGSLVTGFTKNITSYSMTTKNKSIKIGASASSTFATISGTGTKTLNCGSNTYKVKVTAQSGSTKTYTLTIKRECSGNNYLNGITLSTGTINPAFRKEITNYEVKLPQNIEKISITGIKTDSSQTITGEVKDKKLELGSNKITLTVKSESGEKAVYTINVIRGNEGTGNTFLSSLSLSSGSITFNKNTFEYETKVLYNVRNIEVLATTEDKNSKYTTSGGNGLVVGENIIKITVTAENGDTKDYIVKVNRLKEGESFGDNANAKNITVKNYDLKFEYNKLSYKLVIKDEDSLDINVVMDDPNSTYRILGNSKLKDGSIIEIVTTSTDGTSKTYTITITKKSSTPYIIIFGVLIALAIGTVIFAYLRYVKKKKVLLDVNGNKIEPEDEENYRKAMNVPQNKLTQNANNQNNLGNINMPNGQVPQPQPQQPQINNNPANGAMKNSNVCPKCGRELLGTPEVCPYCSTKLK